MKLTYKALDEYLKDHPNDDIDHIVHHGSQYTACSISSCMPLNDLLKLAGITIDGTGITISPDKDMATVQTSIERLTFAQILVSTIIQSEMLMDAHAGPSMFQDNPGSRLWYHHFRLGGDGAVDDLGHGPFEFFILCIAFLKEHNNGN